MQKRKAFTLIELLVVVSIIALLVSILMPALGRARAVANKVVCSTRLKDLGHMYSIYTVDYDGRMVPGYPYPDGRWYYRLGVHYYDAEAGTTQGDTNSRYDVTVFMCTEEEKFSRQDNDTGVAGGADSVFGYNPFFSCPTIPGDRSEAGGGKVDPNPNYRKYWWTKLSQIRQPAELPLYWDRSSAESDMAGNAHFRGYPHPKIMEYGWADESAGPRVYKKYLDWAGPAVNHPRATVFMFADFHVEDRGLWPYQQDMGQPSDNPNDYFRLFHPTRNLNNDPPSPSEKL